MQDDGRIDADELMRRVRAYAEKQKVEGNAEDASPELTKGATEAIKSIGIAAGAYYQGLRECGISEAVAAQLTAVFQGQFLALMLGLAKQGG